MSSFKSIMVELDTFNRLEGLKSKYKFRSFNKLIDDMMNIYEEER